MIRHADLVAVVLTSALVVAVVVFGVQVPTPARILLGLGFLLLVPGSALASLLLPGRGDATGPERLALAVGLSVVAVAFVALAADATPWGVRPAPMAVGLGLLSIVAAMAGHARRRHLPASALAENASWRGVAPMLALVVVVAIAWSATVSVASLVRPQAGATEFYLLGPSGRLEGYPYAVEVGGGLRVTIGVANREGHSVRFHIDVDPTGIVLELPELEDGGVWEHEVEVPAPGGAGRTRFTFGLFRDGDTEPFRTLHLTLDVRTPDRAALDAPAGDGARRAAGSLVHCPLRICSGRWWRVPS